eukprot:CAMPEP_0114613732 /NCGR_PEP_ID=MMETSP0168-20121206/5286_1 /TAXON_ID=95228 ORGANISM="Vannella sp., Strain DIVA3 517/6/12" /NCGR_SAMPLE_ID=MMETSP0168 /ASSEMBLY_ACC=CAM_ASM_000044 /LENGTH=919 /DNA_ID=CAMNT_0001824751 /DNA_START=23 /DNA_END=2778 /DNA_ORIENTATION=+
MKLGILSGELLLENMEVNPEFLKDIMLVQNLTVKHVTVDKLRVKFPWTNLKSEPILFEMDTVTCEVVEGFEYVPPKIRKPSSYGFIGKCFDSITVRIKQINAFVETMDGVPDCPKPRRIRQTLTGLEIMSVNCSFAPAPLADTMYKTTDGKSVIFCKRLQCEKYTFQFETENPVTGESYFATPLFEVPLTVFLRLKKDIADGELLCGEISLLFHHLQVKFREHEFNSVFDMCKGLVASFTKKIAPPDDDGKATSKKKKAARPAAEAPPPSQQADKAAASSAPLEAENDNDGLPAFEIREEVWEDCKSTMVDFEQTKFTVAAPTGHLAMLESQAPSAGDDGGEEEECYARFMFEGMSWTCKLAPYIEKKRKLAERKKKEKEAKGGFFSRKKAAAEVVEQVPAVVVRKKLAHMALNLKTASAVSSRKDHHTLLLGPKPEAVANGKEKKGEKARKKDGKKKKKAKDGKKEEDGKEENNGKKEKGKEGEEEEKPFVGLEWFVRTDTPDEADIEAWLRSLIVDMHIRLSDADFVFDRAAWARILRFMNIGATATTLADATATLELRLHGEATNVTLLVPEAGEQLSEEDQTRDVLLFNAGRVQMGSDVGHARATEFEGGIFRRLREKTVGFPAAEEDFTLGERFSATGKPRKFQFLIEGASGVLDHCLLLEPMTFFASLQLQKYLDSVTGLVTPEQFNAHVQLPAGRLHVTEEQYLRFYSILGAAWDDIRTQFIPQIGGADPDAVDDETTIPALLQAFVKRMHVQLHDADVREAQLAAARGKEDVIWPEPIVQAKLHHAEATSELFNQRKAILIRLKQVLLFDGSSSKTELAEEELSLEDSAALGRFLFYPGGEPADCVSDLRINDVVGDLSSATLARLETLKEGLRSLDIEYAFDPEHNRISSENVSRFAVDGKEGGLPEELL